MSIITIQIGQCGNQIGEKLLETLSSDCYDFKPQNNADRSLNHTYIQESTQRFFEEPAESTSESSPLVARSVLIDMEAKVVNRLVSNTYESASASRQWKFRSSNSYTQKKGSGNNWSYGYCINGPKSSEKIEDIVRRETERCDRLSAFHVCMSLAGGTGSGVGTYYSQLLKTHYPRVTLLNTLVWPFSQGEVILQNYNLLLTLNKIYECSDGLVLLENDVLHQICKKVQLGTKKDSANFDDLNSLIGHQLASILQPARDNLGQHNYIDEVISDLCSHTDYKLLTLTSVPQMSPQSIEYSSFQWPGLYKNARTQLLYPNGEQIANFECLKVLGMSLFARSGSSSESVSSPHEQLRDTHFDDRSRFGTGSIRLWYQRRPFNRYEKSLSVLSNCQWQALRVEQLLEKAWNMFDAKAYVHQYTRYDGFEEADLLNALVFAQQLVKNYKKF